MIDKALTELTAEDWADRLRHHYLSSEVPYGDEPLATIDATPVELRADIWHRCS